MHGETMVDVAAEAVEMKGARPMKPKDGKEIAHVQKILMQVFAGTVCSANAASPHPPELWHKLPSITSPNPSVKHRTHANPIQVTHQKDTEDVQQQWWLALGGLCAAISRRSPPSPW